MLDQCWASVADVAQHCYVLCLLGYLVRPQSPLLNIVTLLFYGISTVFMLSTASSWNNVHVLFWFRFRYNLQILQILRRNCLQKKSNGLCRILHLSYQWWHHAGFKVSGHIWIIGGSCLSILTLLLLLWPYIHGLKLVSKLIKCH